MIFARQAIPPSEFAEGAPAEVSPEATAAADELRRELGEKCMEAMLDHQAVRAEIITQYVTSKITMEQLFTDILGDFETFRQLVLQRMQGEESQELPADIDENVDEPGEEDEQN